MGTSARSNWGRYASSADLARIGQRVWKWFFVGGVVLSCGCGVTAGQIRLSGCAGDEPTRGGSAEAAPGDQREWAIARGDRVVVSRVIPHACCLEADVDASREGSTITVRTEFSGTPCRCFCSSQMEFTSHALQPGAYTVRALVDGNVAAEEQVLIAP